MIEKQSNKKWGTDGGSRSPRRLKGIEVHKRVERLKRQIIDVLLEYCRETYKNIFTINNENWYVQVNNVDYCFKLLFQTEGEGDLWPHVDQKEQKDKKRKI